MNTEPSRPPPSAHGNTAPYQTESSAVPPSDGKSAALTWPYGYGHNGPMKTLAAGKFKDICLQTLDEVASQRRTVVITKRGRPVAKLVPVTSVTRGRPLAGSIVAERGDPFGTGEEWSADRS